MHQCAIPRLRTVKQKHRVLARMGDDKGIERTADIIIDCSGFTLPEISELRDPSLSVSGSTATKRRKVSLKNQGEKKSTISLTPEEAKLLERAAKLLKSAKAQGAFGKLAKIVGEKSLGKTQAALADWRIKTCSTSELKNVRAATWGLALSTGGILVRSREGKMTLFGTSADIFGNRSEQGYAGPGSIADQVRSFGLFPRRAILIVPPNGGLRGSENNGPGKKSTQSQSLPSNYRKVSSTINGQEVQIASQVNGEDVYIIGPESRIDFSRKERDQLQLNFIAENVVAVFLYSSRITAFAEELGGRQSGDLRNPALPTAKGLKTQGASNNRTASGRLSVCQGEDVNARPRSRVIGLDTDCEKVVELFLRDAFREMNVAPDSAPLSVTLRRTVSAGMESIELSSSIPPRYKLEPSESLKSACKLLMTSPIFRPGAVEASVTSDIPPRKRSDRVVAQKVPLDWARMQRVQVTSSVPRPPTPRRSPGKPKARESSSAPGKRG